MATAFLLIIVLQYVENKMEKGKLSMSFSNHGLFIKQLGCNFLIRVGKKKKRNAVKYCYCLNLWSLNFSTSATLLMLKYHEYDCLFLGYIAWAHA